MSNVSKDRRINRSEAREIRQDVLPYAAAASFLEPMGHALAAYGLGTLGEVFDGDPPFRPGGCPAQAWSVAETLRAWVEIDAAARRPRA
jgi:hypothetical protein